MKTRLIFVCVFFTLSISSRLKTHAVNPQWVWATAAGGMSDDQVTSIATDVNGNMYITGYFLSDSITFGNAVSQNRGYFLVKYDSSGNFKWFRDADRSGEGNQGNHVVCDASGHVYVTGAFDTDSISFSGQMLYNTSFNTSGIAFKDIFLVKYDTSGNVIWARNAGGNWDDIGYGLHVYNDTSIMISGEFYSDTMTVGNHVLLNADIFGTFSDIFIIQYDSSGNIKGALREGGTFDDWAQSIAADPSGNMIITGSYGSDSINFSSNVIYNTVGGGSLDYFIAKYNTSGATLWAQGAGAGGSSYDYGMSVVADAAGNIYTSGDFITDTITFGNIRLPHAGMFIVKYDGNGNVRWARCSANQYSGSNLTYLALGNDNSLIAAGSFTRPVLVLENITLFNAQSTGLIYNDAFVAKYDTAGILQWAQRGGGTGDDWVNAVAVDQDGHVYAGGGFNSQAMTFGPSTLNFAGGVDYDVFVAKLEKINIIDVDSKNELNGEIRIFPNPATNQFSVLTGKWGASFKVSVIDMLGNTIMKITDERKELVTLSTENLSQGIYLVEIISGDIRSNGKLIISKQVFK